MDSDRSILSSSVNPLSPLRQDTATCSLRDALDRRRTSRLFLCWAKNKERDREGDEELRPFAFKQVGLQPSSI